MFGMIPMRKAEKRTEYPLAGLPEFEAMFNRFFRTWPAVLEPENLWNVEVEEHEKELLVRAEVPGFETKDFTIEVRGDRLLIKAEHRYEAKPEEKKEPRTRYYERLFTLPAELDPAKVTARYVNGVLEVTLPRKEEAVARKVPIT